MTDLSTRCLDTFPMWLDSLARDAGDLSTALGDDKVTEDARRLVAGGLTYLFKSLDLIPDGIEDLGFLDDAFVLREACRLAAVSSPELAASHPAVSRLASGSALVAELLGDADYARLTRYVKTLTHGAARGRTVDELVAEDEKRAAFVQELHGWAASYEAPTFSRDEKNLVKLQSFLGAKLPA
jgi:uncharacterized membrane protein YkvA (DUF1232 family)